MNTDTFDKETFDASISSKQEVAGNTKSPEKCLYTESYKLVNKSRSSRVKAIDEVDVVKEVKPKAEKTKKASSDEDTDVSSASGSQAKKSESSQEVKVSSLQSALSLLTPPINTKRIQLVYSN